MRVVGKSWESGAGFAIDIKKGQSVDEKIMNDPRLCKVMNENNKAKKSMRVEIYLMSRESRS